MESSKMEPKSGAARNEKKDGEPQAPATALKKAEEQVVVGGEGGGMEDVAVVSVEEEEEAALLATGIQNDHPDGLMGWWRDNSAESVRDLHMVLGGESDLSRGVVGRVWEEMEEAQGMGGRVAVHVSGHVAGDSLGFTLSFGPDELPITSSILVTLRTVRHDRTSGDEWSVGDDDEYVDDGHKFALKLLNASKELPQIKLPTIPIHAVRDASRPLIPGQSAVSILKDEEWKVLNNGGVRPYPSIDSYGPPGEDEENDEEERANLDNLRPDWIGEVPVELEDSRPFVTPPSRNSRSTLYKTALEAPSDVSTRPNNDAVATSLLAALDQSIPHDDDVIISTPPLPPFDDSMDALPRHKRRYERRSDMPDEKSVDEPMDVSPRLERRGADYADEKDEEEGEEIDWDRRSMEAEMEECQQPRCIKRRKLYEDVDTIAKEQQERAIDEMRRADRAEKKLKKVEKEKDELAAMLALLEEEQALRRATKAAIGDVDQGADEGLNDEFLVLPMDAPPPILVFDVPVPATPTPIHPSSTALKVAKAKNLLDGIEKLNPKCWTPRAAGPALLSTWRSMTSKIGHRYKKISTGAEIAVHRLPSDALKDKKMKVQIKGFCDLTAEVVEEYGSLVSLAQEFAAEVAAQFEATGNVVHQKTTIMQGIESQFQLNSVPGLAKVNRWDKSCRALPRC